MQPMARFVGSTARQNEIRVHSNKIALFCFCVGMAAELISMCEDYFQST